MHDEPEEDELPPAQIFDRFARFYDGDYRNYDDDLGLILDLAEEQGAPILEVGCGTGRVMLPLLDDDHQVVGVDVSPALLDVARRKVKAMGYGKLATFIEADLLDVELPAESFAFAVCTSNTLMHFADPEAQQALLDGIYEWLRPDGALLIDLFSPDLPRLFDVNGLMELADKWVDDEGVQVVKWSVRQVDVAEQLQETTFIYEETLPDGATRRTVCPFTLRWLWRSEGELMLRLAGFSVDEVWGDFEGAPYDSSSEHIIFLARKSNA
jgi:SAM-dependent methyltransferase